MRLKQNLLILAILLFATQASMAQYRIYGGCKPKRSYMRVDSTVLNRGIYAVKFTDKNNSPYSISNPQQFLSQRALDRRAKYNIAITEQDLPINKSYVDSLSNMGFLIQGSSKWLK